MKTFRLIGVGLFAIILCSTFSSCSDDDDDEGKNDYNPTSITAVDLGLPSGTLWADRNVGAASPEEYGKHFAWGETVPNGDFNGYVYKWHNWDSGDSYVTKYCNDGNYGYADGKSILEPSDDAATFNLGYKWCMPTTAQIDELAKETTKAWTAINGFKGVRLTGPNGKSIFLPAAGKFSWAEHKYPDTVGYYWSCRLSGYDHPNCAWYFIIHSGGMSYANDGVRSEGYAVRAVVRAE